MAVQGSQSDLIPMISAVQLDVLSEIVNIGAGKAVALLDDMLGHRVQLEVPELLSVSRNELQEHIAIMDSPALVTVRLGFHGAVQGSACLVFLRVAGLTIWPAFFLMT